MNEQDILAKVTSVFRDVFQDGSIVVRKDMTADDVQNWDSLTHIDMIMLIEEEFGIRVPTRAITTMKNVGDLVGIIDSQVNKQ
jgi:acyl carrier protein